MRNHVDHKLQIMRNNYLNKHKLFKINKNKLKILSMNLKLWKINLKKII
jgi:hypothetical protein